MMIEPEFIPLDEIIIEGRQRKTFNIIKIVDLAESITDCELIHAPAVLAGTNILVAGERRLRAMKHLHEQGVPFSYQGILVPRGTIPVTRLTQRDPIALKEAELAENLIREDLTWQERAQAETELHSLRLQQSEGRQTLHETAEELSPDGKGIAYKVSQLSDNILLAKHLEDPDVAKAKDIKTALKLIDQKERALKRKQFREQMQIHTPDEVTSPHNMIQGSADDLLSIVKTGTIDLLLTDPPYGIEANNFNDQFTVKHSYNDSVDTWPILMANLAANSYQVCKPEAHAFVFCDIRRWEELSSWFAQSGWDVWNRPLIWDKGSMGALPRPKHGPRLCYEAIMYAIKGKKEVLKNGRDIIPIPNLEKTYHGAEKPVDLYAELIERTCQPGSHILDPFAGSGTIFPAASKTGCIATGIEILEEHYTTCLERMFK